MHWPSGLNVTPDGTTRPTTGLETPANSSFFISCGTTDSDELVPSTVKISSLMYFRNFHRLKPESHEMKPSTTTTNRTHVRYIVPISFPSDTIEARPYLPTVNDIAPKAARGASRMIIPTTAKIPSMKESSTAITGLALEPMCDSATPNRIAKTRICRMSFLASASTILVGTMLIRKSTKPTGLAEAAV